MNIFRTNILVECDDLHGWLIQSNFDGAPIFGSGDSFVEALKQFCAVAEHVEGLEMLRAVATPDPNPAIPVRPAGEEAWILKRIRSPYVRFSVKIPGTEIPSGYTERFVPLPPKENDPS
jgi:hypothetical protein